jgi:hypothetical protein
MNNGATRNWQYSERPPRHARWAMSGLRARLPVDSAPGGDEAGAIIVLALVFLVAVGALIGSITTWATNDLNNTAKFTSARTLQYAVNGATEVALQNIRYNPQLATTAQGFPGPCWGSGSSLQIDNQNVDVWCTTTTYVPGSSPTRVVTLDACLHGPTASTCVAHPLLEAVVAFTDYPTGFSTPNPAACVAYCGTSMTVNSWNWLPST